MAAKKTTKKGAAERVATTEPVRLPRSARQTADAIHARAIRNPKFWADIQARMWSLIGANDRAAGRVAQVEPRQTAH
jgi:hypothetical protein